MYQLLNISHRHEQIINWLLLNPDKPLVECAKYFGYTQTWLSQIIHSDMFQALYRERCAESHTLAVHTITNELSGLTALAIERATDLIETRKASERFLGDTLRTSLAALGYSSGNGNGNGNGNSAPLVVQINAQTIIQAREKAAAVKEGTTEAKLLPQLPVGPAVQPSTPSGTEELDKLLDMDGEDAA